MNIDKKNRKIQIALAAIAFIFFAVGFYLADPVQAGLCSEAQLMCLILIGDNVGQPMMTFSLALFVISMILIFTREVIFYIWLKFFASWFVPLSVFLIAMMPVDGGSSFFPGPDKESTTWTLGIIFLIISLVIIIVKLTRLRKNQNVL